MAHSDTLLANTPARIRYRLLRTTLKVPDRTQHTQEVSAFCQYLRKISLKTRQMNQWTPSGPWDTDWTGRVNPIFSKAIGEGSTSHHWAVSGGTGRVGRRLWAGSPTGSILSKVRCRVEIAYKATHLHASSLDPLCYPFLKNYAATLLTGT